MVAMSHSLNQQEFLNNIRSTCVCPGEVNTEFLKTRPLQLTEEDVARMLQPSDVGELIAFIATRPAHLCVNEVLVTPTWNRAYAAQFPRRP